MSWQFLDLEELASELEDLQESVDEGEDISLWEPHEQERYEALKALDEELDTLADWARNEPNAIHEDYFEEYCEEFAVDCGLIDRDSSMIYYIDWGSFANDMRHDYTSFEFEGSTYLVRSW